MKRLSIILALATVLALTLSTAALAAMPEDPGAVLGDGVSDFLPPSDLEIIAPVAGGGMEDEIILENSPDSINSIYIPSDNIINGGTQKIHSAYAKNTDACASCHSTHTAVGEALLQWAEVNTTCFACHDGTVAKTYDVVSGKIGDTTKITFGGLFGNGESPSMSVHGVTAGFENAAAPGGSGVATDDTHGTWSAEFTCVACHTPHGQGANARILTPDPNGVALLNKVVGETLTTTDDTVYQAAKANWILGYPYSKSTKVEASTDGGTTWTVVTSTVTINYRTGTVTFASADPSRIVRANYVPGVRVTMDITGMLTASENVVYTGGINTFCGACHTDYNTASVTSPHLNLNGTYTEAYRHKVGFTRTADTPGLKYEMVSGVRTVTCLTCHVAHGTNQQYWIDSLAGVDGGFWTATTAVEFDGSSALKRKPNMGTCESCHSKGAGSTY